MTGDNVGLKNSIAIAKNAAQSDSKYLAIVHLCELRYIIRNGAVDKNCIDNYNQLIPSLPSFWNGEFQFVLSNAAAILNLHELSLNYSLRSAKEFKRIGALKKSVRALMNALASESCIRPEKHYLPDLLYIYRSAKAAGDSISVGTTLINISREYQKLGLFNIAVKYANRSIAIFTRSNPAGLDYCLALTHRAYLYCEIGVYPNAAVDIEAALISNFPEVQSAVKIMSEKFLNLKFAQRTPKNQLSNTQFTNPSWTERRSEDLPKHTSKLESKLIDILIKKPQSKSELCRLLYGDRIDIFAKENRLGNLLNRVRKRHPYLIIFKNDKYYLSETPYFSIDCKV